MMPPPKHVTDSHPMPTHHYQYNQHQHGWKTPNNVYTELRPENSINHVRVSRPIATHPPPTVSSTMRHSSSEPFLPTISPADRTQGNNSPANVFVIGFCACEAISSRLLPFPPSPRSNAVKTFTKLKTNNCFFHK